MIVSRALNCVFIHIHKTGGTSLEKALAPHLGWNDVILGSSTLGEMINDHYRAQFGLDKHSSLAEVEAVCGEDLVRGAFVFSLVRHPVARICSLYNYVGSIVLDWCAGQNFGLDHLRGDFGRYLYSYDALQWMASRAFVTSRSFSDFIRSDYMAGEPAYRSQASRLRHRDGRLCDNVYKLEELASWLPALRQRLGVEIDFPRENPAKLRLIDPRQVEEADRLYLMDHFREDALAFAYD